MTWIKGLGGHWTFHGREPVKISRDTSPLLSGGGHVAAVVTMAAVVSGPGSKDKPGSETQWSETSQHPRGQTGPRVRLAPPLTRTSWATCRRGRLLLTELHLCPAWHSGLLERTSREPGSCGPSREQAGGSATTCGGVHLGLAADLSLMHAASLSSLSHAGISPLPDLNLESCGTAILGNTAPALLSGPSGKPPCRAPQSCQSPVSLVPLDL